MERVTVAGLLGSSSGDEVQREAVSSSVSWEQAGPEEAQAGGRDGECRERGAPLVLPAGVWSPACSVGCPLSPLRPTVAFQVPVSNEHTAVERREGPGNAEQLPRCAEGSVQTVGSSLRLHSSGDSGWASLGPWHRLRPRQGQGGQLDQD